MLIHQINFTYKYLQHFEDYVAAQLRHQVQPNTYIETRTQIFWNHTIMEAL